MRQPTIWLFLLCAVCAAEAHSETDFVLIMDKCKMMVGFLALSDESLKVLEGEPLNYACQRRSKRIKCVMQFKEGGKV